ncbi:hypothetical protein C8R47DRAFT_1067902 [Mycena vitilis]|nr:hypothetical protein C8R47DRAFT_1067902 [Mycena vitilis]
MTPRSNDRVPRICRPPACVDEVWTLVLRRILARGWNTNANFLMDESRAVEKRRRPRDCWDGWNLGTCGFGRKCETQDISQWTLDSFYAGWRQSSAAQVFCSSSWRHKPSAGRDRVTHDLLLVDWDFGSCWRLNVAGF